jgi:hypothetical protein
MDYVIDTNSLRVFGNYYPHVFGSFWERIDRLVGDERLGSVREVKKEVLILSASDHLNTWVETNGHVFPAPTSDEMGLVAEILGVPHFAQLISAKAILRGGPAADPFIVARARSLGAAVITEEELKPNAAKIPNVCQHFGIQCINVEQFLTSEGWRF